MSNKEPELFWEEQNGSYKDEVTTETKETKETKETTETKETKEIVSKVLEESVEEGSGSVEDGPLEFSTEPIEEFDPRVAAERLTKRLKTSDPVEDQKPTPARDFLFERGDKTTIEDLQKLFEFSDNVDPERRHPSENIQLTTDIYGNKVNPAARQENINTYATQIILPNDFEGQKDDRGFFDPSIGAQSPMKKVELEEYNNPESDAFYVCVTRGCPVKENCLRYRLKNRRENKIPYFPEECSKGGEGAGFTPLTKFPEFTAYDHLDPENIWSMPSI